VVIEMMKWKPLRLHGVMPLVTFNVIIPSPEYMRTSSPVGRTVPRNRSEESEFLYPEWFFHIFWVALRGACFYHIETRLFYLFDTVTTDSEPRGSASEEPMDRIRLVDQHDIDTHIQSSSRLLLGFVDSQATLDATPVGSSWIQRAAE